MSLGISLEQQKLDKDYQAFVVLENKRASFDSALENFLKKQESALQNIFQQYQQELAEFIEKEAYVTELFTVDEKFKNGIIDPEKAKLEALQNLFDTKVHPLKAAVDGELKKRKQVFQVAFSVFLTKLAQQSRN